MAVARVAGGQVGSDTTGNFSQSFAAGTCNGAIVFIVSNATNAAPVSGNVTYGGVAMKFLGSAIDNTTELLRVDAYFLGGLSFPSGTQTIAFTQSGGATKRVYAISMSCAAGYVLDLYKNPFHPDSDALPNVAALGTITDVDSTSVYDSYNGFGFRSVSTTLANPSKTLAIPANRTVYVGACLASGIAAASLSVATGNQIAEANFSGNAQSASLADNGPTNNGNLTVGWTQSADDAAACYVFVEECKVIGGNVTKEAVATEDSVIEVSVSSDAAGLNNRRTYMTVESDSSGDWTAHIPKGLYGWATCTFNDGGTLYVSLPHGPISST